MITVLGTLDVYYVQFGYKRSSFLGFHWITIPTDAIVQINKLYRPRLTSIAEMKVAFSLAHVHLPRTPYSEQDVCRLYKALSWGGMPAYLIACARIENDWTAFVTEEEDRRYHYDALYEQLKAKHGRQWGTHRFQR